MKLSLQGDPDFPGFVYLYGSFTKPVVLHHEDFHDKVNQLRDLLLAG